MLRRLLVIVFLGTLSLLGTRLQAQTNSWGASAQALVNANNNQNGIVAANIQSGLVMMAWVDARSAVQTVYAGTVKNTGMIGPNGNPVAVGLGTQSNPSICPDGTGGAVIVWQDARNPNTGIFGQRVNTNINGFWNASPGGDSIAGGPQNLSFPILYAGPSNSFYVIYLQALGSSTDIYCQRIDFNGNNKWLNPSTVCNAAGNQNLVSAVSDNAGGLIITWFDARGANGGQIFANRIDSNGLSVWTTTTGLPISGNSKAGGRPAMVMDGSGGAIIAWTDGTTGTDSNIVAQRIDLGGNKLWASNGVSICNTTGNQNEPIMLSDGNGGAFIAWQDRHSGTYDVTAIHIDGTGAPIAPWVTNGTTICNAAGDQTSIQLAADGNGGIIISWTDARQSTSPRLYSAFVDSRGTIRWKANGSQNSTGTGVEQNGVTITQGLQGNAFVAWEDNRNASTSGTDLYGQWIGYTPDITTSRASMNFGVVRTKTQVTDTLQIINSGNDTLIVNSFSLTGPSTIDPLDTVYSILYPTKFPFKLAPGKDSVMIVRFWPSDNRADSGVDTIVIHSNALTADSLFRVPLSGSGKYPHFKSASDTIFFGNVRVHNILTKTVTFTNFGTDTGHILGHSIIGGFNQEFRDSATNWAMVTSPTPFDTVNPGSSVTLSLSCEPTKAGQKTAQLQLITDDSTSPYSIYLIATGTFPKTKLSATTLNYNKVRVHTTISKFITISNIGNDTLHIDSILTSGDAKYYTDTLKSFPYAVPPSASLQLNVNFSPDSVRKFGANFQIFTDDSSVPYLFSCTGNGSNATLQVPSLIAFGAVPVGNAPSDTLKFSYSGTDTVKIISGVFTGPDSALFSFNPPNVPFPLNVTTGQNLILFVKFQPDIIKHDTATLIAVAQYVGGSVDTFYIGLSGGPSSGVFSPAGLPTGLTLSQMYPNPIVAGAGNTNRSTIIINADQLIPSVELNLFNMAGQRLQSLYHGTLTAGSHNIPVDVSSLPAGEYVYTLTTRSGAASRMFTVVR